ncbi:MAG TPA: alpha/beta hydrolase [Gemmatimonadaceae bacterium]|nr:alpha/beta hydrolase [Gemmatimonadaceae bacterium]
MSFAPPLALCVALAICAPSSAVAQADTTNPERLRGVQVLRGAVATDAGFHVQTILTRPAGTTRRLPAIYFIQWLSCDPVSLTPTDSGGWTLMLRGLIERSGLVVMRTEKPGLGGSGGPPCDQLGYDTDLAAHRAALRVLRTSPWVHPDSIIIYGASMGGTMAPLLARDLSPLGVIVWGTTGYSWRDHLLALDARVLRFRGVPNATVEAVLPVHRRFHDAYLVERRNPPDLTRGTAAFDSAWRRMIGTEATNQYGRPFAFHQQAHHANWVAAWPAIKSPVLVAYGEYDWIMAPDEHLRIRELVTDPSRVAVLARPRTDHHFTVFQSQADAFAERGGRPDSTVIDAILDWVTQLRKVR